MDSSIDVLLEESASFQSSEFQSEDEDNFLILTDESDTSLDLFQFSETSIQLEEVQYPTTPLRKKRKILENVDPLEQDVPASKSFLPYCKENCVSKLSLWDQRNFRAMFASKNRSEQQQFLLDSTFICKPTSAAVTNRSSRCEMLMLQGTPLCKRSFLQVLNVTEKRFRKVMELRSNGVHVSKRKQHVRSEMVKSSEAKTWMRRYFHLVGEHLPHVQRIHLPHFLTKRDIYGKMKSELMQREIPENDIITASTFYRFWKSDFPDVLIPKQSSFSKCDICTKFDQERVKSGGREGFKEEYSKHLRIVEQERKKYYGHREKARSNPDKCLTIIIDGMDQHKTNLPRLSKAPKAVQGLFPLRTHVTGVLVHTKAPHGKLAYVFVDLLQYPHDCNITIHVLLEVLLKQKKLPPVLNIQLDNTAKENKNRYFLGFCSLLVFKGIFQKIRLNFLPVGHTHEDIDQLFSRISRQLSRTGATSLPELEESISVSSTPTPSVKVIESIFDVRLWILPFLDGLNGHSVPHCFKFVKEEDTALMYYKLWSDDPWCETNQAASLLMESPQGLPQLLTPSDSKIDLERLKLDLPKFYPWLTNSSREWWEKFDVDNVYSPREFEHQIVEWPLLILQEEKLNLLAEPTSEQSPLPLNSDLQALFAAESTTCNVYTGCRKSSVSKVQEVRDLSGLNAGHLIAVRSNDAAEPWIARVLEIAASTIRIVWLKGTYSSKWTVAKQQDPSNRKRKIDWEDSIPKESIILYAFELTEKDHLRKKTVEHLKKAYSNIKEKTV